MFFLVGILIGYSATKRWYQTIVTDMTNRNQELIERVKKAESIILHDLLQLTPDDIDLLKKNMEEDAAKSVTKE